MYDFLMQALFNFLTNLKGKVANPRILIILKALLAGIFLLALAGFYILFMSGLIGGLRKCGYSDCAWRFLKGLLLFGLFLLVSIPSVILAYRAISRVFQKQEQPVFKNVKRRVTSWEVFKEAREYVLPAMPLWARVVFVVLLASYVVSILTLSNSPKNVSVVFVLIGLGVSPLILFFFYIKKIAIERIRERERLLCTKP